jgi:hypothetical protein
MMLHRCHFATLTKGHAQRLDGRRAERVEQHVVGPRADHLDRLADGFGGKRCGDSVVAVEPPPEATAEEISAHEDLVLADSQRFGQEGQHQRLPLIPGVDLENAVLLDSLANVVSNKIDSFLGQFLA